MEDLTQDAIARRDAGADGTATARSISGFPTDLLAADVGVRGWTADGPGPVAPDRAAVGAAVSVLAGARRPLVWAGGGALRDGAGEAVGALAEALAAPILLTYGARGLLPPSHPCLVGLPPHVPEAGALWDEADAVVAVGSDLDGMNTQNWAQPQPPALVAVNLDRADATKSYAADVVIEADAGAGAAALAAALPGRGGLTEVAEQLTALRTRARARLAREQPAELEFLDAFAAAVPPEAVVVADMCIPGYWLGGFHPVPAPRRFQYPVGWGTLGFAFPAAIGAAAADPSRPVVAVCGDGGFLFACGELATVAQERLPITVLLVDDGGYGMLRYDRRGAGARARGNRSPDAGLRAARDGIRDRCGGRRRARRRVRRSACAARRRSEPVGARRPRDTRAAGDDLAALVPPARVRRQDPPRARRAARAAGSSTGRSRSPSRHHVLSTVSS